MVISLRRLLPLLCLSIGFPVFAQDGYKVVIDFQYQEAKNFSPNGLASVRNNNYEWGYIDQTGKVVIDFQFLSASAFSSNGLANVEKSIWNFGFIDETGKVKIDFQFQNAGNFSSNGLACAKKNDKWGYIDETGRSVIDYQYKQARDFSPNGLASVEKDGKWGYIDGTGKTVIDFQFDDARDFSSNGLAPVEKNKKWGYIDQTGKTVIDFQFDDAKKFSSNGLAPVRNYGEKGWKWGYIDQTGKLAIDLQFDEACGFSLNGLASVESNNKWGYIDQTGKVVIDFQFEDDYLERNFSFNGLACVKKNGKWGYIKAVVPKNDIAEYIKTEIEKWQQKGKFETIETYSTRVTETNRQKKVEELMSVAINNVAATYCNWQSTSNEYDPDHQTYKITVTGLPPFFLKVPLVEAEGFDAAFSKLQYSNQAYMLNSDGKFYLQRVTIKNPNNGKVYNYSSTDNAIFAVNQLNINFEPLQLNVQPSGTSQTVNSETKTLSVGQADVDVNIPVNLQTNSNTFAVIIANENYQKEVKVKFASNDGKVFKEYCEKTLGIPAQNIHFVTDATFGNMKSEIKWITDVISAYKGQAKVIFYYAGHGMPNESDKSAYLLPVDGFSSDFETAIKLNDLYSRLTENSSQSVTFILDACFSGSARDNGMLAEARGVKVKPRTEVLNGNSIVFSAATGDETAYPYIIKQHGLFTYFLLKKLQETKGDATYKDLIEYIKTNVGQQSVVVNQKSQTPQVQASQSLQGWEMMRLK